MARISDMISDVEAYWSKRWRVLVSSKDFFLYSYVRNTGKYSLSNSLSEIKIRRFKPQHYVIWEVMLHSVKQSREPLKSGVVKFVYEDYKEYCSNKMFYEARIIFLEEKLILPTVHSKYFILNPTFINKFYSTKIWKKEKTQE